MTDRLPGKGGPGQYKPANGQYNSSAGYYDRQGGPGSCHGQYMIYNSISSFNYH
jgi:hypothetical protein